MIMKKPKNIHRGSSFTGFLRKEGLYEEVEAAALKKVIAAALTKQMNRRGMTVSELADRLGTSRAAVGRVLDEQNTSITLNTISRAASAVGCEVRLDIVPAA
jgi:antitoxin HicB